MATTIEELQVLITAKTSGLQKELNKVTGQLKGAEEATTGVSDAMAAAMKDQEQALAAAKKRSDELSSALKSTNEMVDAQRKNLTALKAEGEGIMSAAVAEMQRLETESAKMDEYISDLNERLTEQQIVADQAAEKISGVADAVTGHGNASSETKSKLDLLNQSLENTNARIDLQKQKIADLKAQEEGLTSAAVSEMQKLEQESFELEESIRGLTDRLNELKESQANSLGDFHGEMIADEIKQVETSLSGLIEQADKVGEKMADLNDAGDNTKLKERIASAESALISLEQKADRTRGSIEKAMKNPEKPIKNTNRAIKNVTQSLRETEKTAKQTSNSFVSGFKRIAKQVLVFAVIYKAIRGLTCCAKLPVESLFQTSI